ncbi:MAG TPA: 3-deoxy-manno-octulosonate cytidylyltransferase [Acetobacteraceae bacterium]|nr:3-deoxy-manno-octulosonate cytidylyltransferase [Acetobacteraceae bacterium]
MSGKAPSTVHPVVVIPTRLGSTRLPGKALTEIAGDPMIVHVWRRGIEAGIGPVYVACGDAPIADAIRAVGGQAVLTDPALPTGSDRVQAALAIIDPERRHDVIVVLQGDLPTIEPSILHATLAPLADPAVDIATLATVITDPLELQAPQVVKIALAISPGAQMGRAIYFSRAVIPGGAGPHYHHVGLYTYRRAALERFVRLPQGVLEQRENLEQLRALENGMRIDVAVIESEPLGVDTLIDLERARVILGNPNAA